MAASNPRISVVLSPSLAATLSALSEASGESVSALVRQFLEQAEGPLQRMVALLEAARLAKGRVSSGLAGSLDRTVSELEDVMAVMDSRMARATRDLVAEAQAVKGRRRPRPGAAGAGAAASSTPVPVTRGSGGGKTRTTGDRSPGQGVRRVRPV